MIAPINQTQPVDSERLLQLNMFGPPEDPSSYSESARLHDDAPVPCERELLWPGDLAGLLGLELLERLYGDVPRRTRLHVREICRRLRCDSQHVYNLREAGSLDAVDISTPGAGRHEWRFYRYSLVRWLFRREFRNELGRADLSDEDMRRITRAVATLGREGARNGAEQKGAER